MNLKHKNNFKEQIAGYLFIAPFFAIYSVFSIWPLIYSGFISFFKWDLISDKKFIGFENYAYLFKDSFFIKALVNTLILCITSSVPQLIFAMLIAYLVNLKFVKYKDQIKMGVFLPYLTSTVAVTLVFGTIFGSQYGIVNYLFKLIGAQPIDWRVSQIGAYVALSSMIIWRWTGYNSILYLAALQEVPEEILEASLIDGANKWKQFFSIIIPQIKPVIMFTIITSTIGGLQIFTEPYLFIGNFSGSAGGINHQGLTLSVLLYEEAFSRQKFGYSSAVACVIFVIIVIISLINTFITDKVKE